MNTSTPHTVPRATTVVLLSPSSFLCASLSMQSLPTAKQEQRHGEWFSANHIKFSVFSFHSFPKKVHQHYKKHLVQSLQNHCNENVLNKCRRAKSSYLSSLSRLFLYITRFVSWYIYNLIKTYILLSFFFVSIPIFVAYVLTLSIHYRYEINENYWN